MIKYINYHFLYLFNKKGLITLLLIFLLSFIVFFYLAGGFYSEAERLMLMSEYLYEYNKEAFMLINIILGFWIINSSKEMFIIDEPHVLIINKKKYIYTKIIAYYLFYMFICLFLYSIYQIVSLVLYGFRKFNYIIFVNLLFNISLTHLFILLISGSNKNILLTILLFISYMIVIGLYFINFNFVNIILFFYPFSNDLYPIYGYLHIVLINILLFTIVFYKHYTNIH